MFIPKFTDDAPTVESPTDLRPVDPPASAPTSSFLLRRLALALSTIATITGIAWLAVAAYGVPSEALGWSVLVLFVAAMAWQAFTAWQYIYGGVAALLGDRAKSALERRSATIPATPTGLSRTAAVVAIHAEDPVAVFAAIRVMARSLQHGCSDSSDLDIFVLSDTREGAISAIEEHEFARIQTWAKTQGPGIPSIRYRRRQTNEGRKAGNIGEFCRRHGHEYDFMIVLDADSLMTGPTMRRLVRLIEENPRAGLIQTVSYAAGRDTLFARIQQFAVRLYAPLSLRCLEHWQGPDGSYWGHNAILRIGAFVQNAELPVLSGKPPLGGEILCHDIVEGALLRRAGWDVHLLPEMGGTWEEMPTNLIDLLGRDRRWCQGNLQHSRVVPMKGLGAASRWHMIVGILMYLAYPVWVAFLALGTVQAVRTGDLGLLGYGLTGGTPAAWMLAASVLMILALPKFLSLVYVLTSAQRRAAFGGTVSLLTSAALEQLAWVLLWPVMALFASSAVLTTLLGRIVRWDAQSRDDRQVPWREAARLQIDAILVGVTLAMVLAYAADLWLALWMAPLVVALVSGPAQSVLTSRADLGLRSKALGLFLTEDDVMQARELGELHQSRTLAPGTVLAPPAVKSWLTRATDKITASAPQ